MKSNINTSLGIFDYDYEIIDQALLKTNVIKDKHIFRPIDLVPTQGSPFLGKTTTSENVLKNHHKKLS